MVAGTWLQAYYLCGMEKTFTLQDIRELAGECWKLVKDRKVIAFHGEMGAGKTTLIHAICEKLGVKARETVVTGQGKEGRGDHGEPQPQTAETEPRPPDHGTRGTQRGEGEKHLDPGHKTGSVKGCGHRNGESKPAPARIRLSKARGIRRQTR